MYRRIVLSEKQNEQLNEKLNEAVVYGDTSGDTKPDGAVYASSILLFKSQFAFEHVDNFSFQNSSLGDKAVIKKRHCRTVVVLPF